MTSRIEQYFLEGDASPTGDMASTALEFKQVYLVRIPILPVLLGVGTRLALNVKFGIHHVKTHEGLLVKEKVLPSWARESR